MESNWDESTIEFSFISNLLNDKIKLLKADNFDMCTPCNRKITIASDDYGSLSFNNFVACSGTIRKDCLFKISEVSVESVEEDLQYAEFLWNKVVNNAPKDAQFALQEKVEKLPKHCHYLFDLIPLPQGWHTVGCSTPLYCHKFYYYKTL